MVESFMAHINGFIVDSIFVLLAALSCWLWKTTAAKLVLANYSIILVLVYVVLAYLNYSSTYIVDYHLLMAVYVAAFSILIQVKVKRHGLLKLALWANVALHGVMILKEPAYQLDHISYTTYIMIYDGYSQTRIGIVSLQILGLIDGRYDGGRSDIIDRIRYNLSRHLNDFRVYSIRLPRVKKQ